MIPCPLCGRLLPLAPEAWGSHFRSKHPGEQAPRMGRKSNVPRPYDEADIYTIEMGIKRRDRKVRKYGWRRGA